VPDLHAGLDVVYRYHDGTKHQFHRFAPSLGYLDWASQPKPFRHFDGAPLVPLPPSPEAPAAPATPPVPYDRVFEPQAIRAAPLTAAGVGDLLRHSLGLSAWKVFRHSRWSLRVNPSSGNLHPTEAYLVGLIPGLTEGAAVFHYAADRHGLEVRSRFDPGAWLAVCPDNLTCLVVLTSIHWRESWKYGERAFRYCQHDLGHAIAAVRLAAALGGWRAVVLPEWAHRSAAALVGIDRDQDYVDAEREEPGCVMAVTASDVPDALRGDHAALVAAVRRGVWSGRASQLSEDHVQWTFIDEIAGATEAAGRRAPVRTPVPEVRSAGGLPGPCRLVDARAVILQRRSAVALDGRTSVGRDRFFAMLRRALPGPGAPWDALWWEPCIHFLLFVHRVDGLDPGLYLLARTEPAIERLKAAVPRAFAWARVDEALPLFLLMKRDCRALAARVSCGQEIAADGFFSLGMIAEFTSTLEAYGRAFYRNLFWESGVVGQVLYLEAEAAGARGTGIGCFFDDPVHDVLGLTGHAFQSVYHFTIGAPIEDARLTTAPGYAWEREVAIGPAAGLRRSEAAAG
jgi:SagB-type dehydrogenase family enzyme